MGLRGDIIFTGQVVNQQQKKNLISRQKYNFLILNSNKIKGLFLRYVNNIAAENNQRNLLPKIYFAYNLIHNI